MESRAFPTEKEFVFVVDFTWNNGRLTLLEMGDFYRSCISGLDHLRKMEGKGPLDDEIKARIKTTYPQAIYLNDQSDPWSCSVELHDFKQGINSTYNMKYLYSINRLIEARAVLPDTVQPLRSLLVTMGLRSGLEVHAAIHLESILEASQNFCLLNFPSGGLYYSCVNKVAFYLFNQDSGIVPATCLVDLVNFDENHVNEFLEKFGDKHFVIKPTDKSQGKGVVVKSREEILVFLARLHDYRRSRGRFGTITQDDYWRDATDRFLLLQTCCPSKRIQGGYQPTGRVVMRAKLSGKDRLTQIEYLGGYWKLPASISEEPCTQSVVSDVYGIEEPHVASIDQEDWAAITHEIDYKFSPILRKMFLTSTLEMARQFEHHNDPVMRHYGEYEYPARVNPDATEQKKPSIENKLDALVGAGVRCFEELTYRSPGSMDNRNHFVSAALGLECDVQCVNRATLKTALYRQVGMECELPESKEIDRSNIDVQSSITEVSPAQQATSINNTNTLFNLKLNNQEDRVVATSQNGPPCNIF